MAKPIGRADACNLVAVDEVDGLLDSGQVRIAEVVYDQLAVCEWSKHADYVPFENFDSDLTPKLALFRVIVPSEFTIQWTTVN